MPNQPPKPTAQRPQRNISAARPNGFAISQGAPLKWGSAMGGLLVVVVVVLAGASQRGRVAAQAARCAGRSQRGWGAAPMGHERAARGARAQEGNKRCHTRQRS
eukprot:5277791-Pyramimonas_sp.AAC.1